MYFWLCSPCKPTQRMPKSQIAAIYDRIPKVLPKWLETAERLPELNLAISPECTQSTGNKLSIWPSDCGKSLATKKRPTARTAGNECCRWQYKHRRFAASATERCWLVIDRCQEPTQTMDQCFRWPIASDRAWACRMHHGSLNAVLFDRSREWYLAFDVPITFWRGRMKSKLGFPLGGITKSSGRWACSQPSPNTI